MPQIYATFWKMQLFCKIFFKKVARLILLPYLCTYERTTKNGTSKNPVWPGSVAHAESAKAAEAHTALPDAA